MASNISRPASSAAPSAATTPDNWVSSPTHDTYAVPIEKSPLDDRTYQLIRLPNGLEALLIHDEHTDKSTAAIDVKVGHLSDPKGAAGLAHYLEHMLFLVSRVMSLSSRGGCRTSPALYAAPPHH